jgi:hypothetical protein
MLVSIDIVFYGPQIHIPYTMRGATVGDRGPWRGCLLIQQSPFYSTHRWARHQKNLSPISDIRHRYSLVRYRTKIYRTEGLYSDIGLIRYQKCLIRYRKVRYPILTNFYINTVAPKSSFRIFFFFNLHSSELKIKSQRIE